MAHINILRRAAPYMVVFAAVLWLWQVNDTYAIQTRLDRMGPDAWPRIVLLLLMAASIWGVIEAVVQPADRPRAETGIDEADLLSETAQEISAHEATPQDDPENAGEGLRPHGVYYAVAGMAALLLYVFVIRYIGYTIATFLILFSISMLAGYTKALKAALISLIGALVFFFIFQRVTYISLPLGVGPFKALSTALMALMGVR